MNEEKSKKFILDLFRRFQKQDKLISEILKLFSCRGCKQKSKLDGFRNLTFGSKIPEKQIPKCIHCSRFHDDLYRGE